MPATLRGLGWTEGHEAFRRLSATQQLPYVERYFLPYKSLLSQPYSSDLSRDGLGSTAAALYVATFLPALLKHAHNPDFVLTAKNGPLGWAYGPNAVFDRNKDLAITVRELGEAIERNCRGKRWSEIVARLAHLPVVQELADYGFDLRTTIGVQRALERLGYEPGPIDGIPGARTRAAVRAFQQDHTHLVADGIFGPRTRAALEIALRTSA